MDSYELMVDNRVPGPSLCCVRLSGEVDIKGAPQLRDEIERCMDEACRHLLIDIDAVKYLDSNSLGAFVGVRQRMKQRGGTVGFICHNPKLQRLFDMTNLDKLFAFYDGVEEFVAAHSQHVEQQT